MLFGHIGSNMQNPTKEICKLYEVDDIETKSFVQPDQSGAEALIVAYLCRPDGNYRKLFLNNIKPHTYMAMQLFKLGWFKEGFQDVSAFCKFPIGKLNSFPEFKRLCKSIKNNYARYYLGKKTMHAYSYGMGAKTLASQALKESEGLIALDSSEANKFLAMVGLILPEISEDFQAGVKSEIKRTGKLRNLFEFPREVYETLNEENVKKYYAFIPQSTVGCISNIAMVRMYNFIRKEKLNWDILNNKHDSMLIQCPDSEIKECATKAQEFMSMDLKSTFTGERFKMRSEVSVGKNWGSYDEETNPLGLKEYNLTS
jgi:hypothetical protein